MKKKNKFLTVVFSFVPGAGHMYMGYMRAGLSLMTLFVAIIFVSSWLDIGPLLFLLPVLWFYSLFDALNRYNKKDGVFDSYEDDTYLIFPDTRPIKPGLTKKWGAVLGWALVLLGIYMMFYRIVHTYYGFEFSEYYYHLISGIMRVIPSVAASVVIIFIGFWLIKKKKKEAGGEND